MSVKPLADLVMNILKQVGAFAALWRLKDERVYGDDTSHDHGDERLRNFVSSNPCTSLQASLNTFMIKSGLKVPTPAIPIPAFAVPYAAPAPALCLAGKLLEPHLSVRSSHPNIIYER